MKNRIAELRKNKKASQDDVAKALGITRQAISLYERGEHEPKLETWKKLASFFDVSVPYLQGIEPNFDLLTSETKDFILNKLDSISNDLQNRGMKFVGSTIIYSYLQAVGFIYSHDENCFLHA